MVGSVSVSLDRAVGNGDAAAAENAKGRQAAGLYVGMRGTWIFIWNIVRTRAGSFVRVQPGKNDCMDCCGASMGFSAWSQQFFLRDSDCADNLCFAAGRPFD